MRNIDKGTEHICRGISNGICSFLQVNWQPVIVGMYLQIILGLFVLRTHWGLVTFQWLADRVTEYLHYTDVGAEFVFGPSFRDHMFAMQVSAIIQI